MTLAPLRCAVNRELEKSLDSGDFGGANRLRDGCRYALLSGGKRWRPIFAMAISKSLGVELDPGALVALECIHAASLIIDDSPVFDNDSIRRGKAALHMVFGEMVAQLVTVSLVAAAFRFMTRAVDNSGLPDADRRGMLLMCSIADNIGALGAAGGQFLDSCPGVAQSTNPAAIRDALKRNPPAPLELQKILALKTGAFFEMAMVTGWVLSGGNLGELDAIRAMAVCFGLAFQIADDFSDMEQDLVKARATGLPSVNYVLNFGPKEASETFAKNAKRFVQEASMSGVLSEPLREMVSVLLGVVKGVSRSDASVTFARYRSRNPDAQSRYGVHKKNTREISHRHE